MKITSSSINRHHHHRWNNLFLIITYYLSIHLNYQYQSVFRVIIQLASPHDWDIFEALNIINDKNGQQWRNTESGGSWPKYILMSNTHSHSQGAGIHLVSWTMKHLKVPGQRPAWSNGRYAPDGQSIKQFWPDHDVMSLGKTYSIL